MAIYPRKWTCLVWCKDWSWTRRHSLAALHLISLSSQGNFQAQFIPPFAGTFNVQLSSYGNDSTPMSIIKADRGGCCCWRSSHWQLLLPFRFKHNEHCVPLLGYHLAISVHRAASHHVPDFKPSQKTAALCVGFPLGKLTLQEWFCFYHFSSCREPPCVLWCSLLPFQCG